MTTPLEEVLCLPWVLGCWCSRAPGNAHTTCMALPAGSSRLGHLFLPWTLQGSAPSTAPSPSPGLSHHLMLPLLPRDRSCVKPRLSTLPLSPLLLLLDHKLLLLSHRRRAAFHPFPRPQEKGETQHLGLCPPDPPKSAQTLPTGTAHMVP